MIADIHPTPRPRQSKTYVPLDEERQELLAFAQVLNGIDAQAHAPGQAVLVGPHGERLPIPSELFEVLEQVANALAFGDGVTVMPYAAKLTTQEAADFLGMSRPTLIKLLEAGEIPFEKVGRHRRVTLRDIDEYRERAGIERRAALADLARDSLEQPTPPASTTRLRRRNEAERT